jgi:hypothetical protein
MTDNYKLLLDINDLNDIILNNLDHLAIEDNIVNINNILIQLFKINNDNIVLKKKLDTKEQELIDLSKKYKEDMNAKNFEINTKEEEMVNYSKVSIFVLKDKELNEKKNYIKILETQIKNLKNEILKLKNNKFDEKLHLNEEIVTPICNINITEELLISIDEEIPTICNENIVNNDNKKLFTSDDESQVLKKKKKKKNDTELYETILYKNTSYIKNIITNEVFDILDNKPNNLIGHFSQNGKIIKIK